MKDGERPRSYYKLKKTKKTQKLNVIHDPGQNPGPEK